MILQIAEVKEIGRYDFGSCASLFGLRRGIIVLSFYAVGSSPVSHDLLINFGNINIFIFGNCIITGKQSTYICDETKKMALSSQTVRAKINPPPVGPRWAHAKTNTRQ